MKNRENKKKRNEKWVGNQIGSEGAKTISESLKINTSLTELYLDCDEKDKKWKEREKNKSEEMNR